MSGRSVSVYADTRTLLHEYLCALIQNDHSYCKYYYMNMASLIVNLSTPLLIIPSSIFHQHLSRFNQSRCANSIYKEIARMDRIVNLIISKLKKLPGITYTNISTPLSFHRVVIKYNLLVFYQCIHRQNSERTKTVISNEKLFKFLDEECPSKVNKLFLEDFASLCVVTQV